MEGRMLVVLGIVAFAVCIQGVPVRNEERLDSLDTDWSSADKELDQVITNVKTAEPAGESVLDEAAVSLESVERRGNYGYQPSYSPYQPPYQQYQPPYQQYQPPYQSYQHYQPPYEPSYNSYKPYGQSYGGYQPHQSYGPSIKFEYNPYKQPYGQSYGYQPSYGHQGYTPSYQPSYQPAYNAYSATTPPPAEEDAWV